MTVLYRFKNHGKTEAIKEFDVIANSLMNKYEKFDVIMKISFMVGLLVPNGILTEEESDTIGKRYTYKIMNELIEN